MTRPDPVLGSAGAETSESRRADGEKGGGRDTRGLAQHCRNIENEGTKASLAFSLFSFLLSSVLLDPCFVGVFTWYQTTRNSFLSLMADSSSSSSSATLHTVAVDSDPAIPPKLKFFMSTIKTLVNTQLSTENYPVWKAQVYKLFSANGFEDFLTGAASKPSKQVKNLDGSLSPNPLFHTWFLIDQNLAAAIFSTIGSSLLPYVLNLDSCHEIWVTIERRLQSSNRSRLLQLKNEMHHVQMNDQTMVQYLSVIKQKIDAITAAGSSVPTEDIILYTLNGLPPTYQGFKTALRTQLQPINLDDFYSLLCSEELNIAAETARATVYTSSSTDQAFSLATTRGRFRGRGSYQSSNRGRSTGPGRGRGRTDSSSGRVPNTSNRGGRPPCSYVECQICAKPGHQL
ncbi:uncharacterized protein LOC110096231 [Dendrobium catenatum]|uniref:uncharacterized protein LOC110096231 n=1 Tax=Dendrobium catenatum TaxID=906689 RepID=UPI0009F5C599|nr:uncharacterized protein LOC110096231 [Dendrobium catenatum]